MVDIGAKYAFVDEFGAFGLDFDKSNLPVKHVLTI